MWRQNYEDGISVCIILALERKRRGKVKLKSLAQTGLHQPVCVGLAPLQRLELTTIKGPLKRWRASVDHPSPRPHNMKVKN